MEDNLRQEETAQQEVIPEPFQEPNDMQMESPDDGQDSEAKKFQSMYDKKSADYDRLSGEVGELKKLEKLGTMLKDRPDVVEAMKRTLSGEQVVNEQPQKQEETLDENSFDPWEAYYKPGSESYEMRVREQKSLVNQAVSEQMKGIQESVAVNNLKGELSSKHGFKDPQQVDDFIQFATQPRQDVPLEMLVDVYKRFNGSPNNQSGENLEAAKRTQAMPQSAGVLQGGVGKKPDEIEDVWQGVMGANSRSNIL
jgi:hypothetical protein|tara:strand:- start:598 stop:1356 length:759 start_codon:yes stop_codon:yes gene_type:complete